MSRWRWIPSPVSSYCPLILLLAYSYEYRFLAACSVARPGQFSSRRHFDSTQIWLNVFFLFIKVLCFINICHNWYLMTVRYSNLLLFVRLLIKYVKKIIIFGSNDFRRSPKETKELVNSQKKYSCKAFTVSPCVSSEETNNPFESSCVMNFRSNWLLYNLILTEDEVYI